MISRRSFFKKIGILAGAAVLTPGALLELRRQRKLYPIIKPLEGQGVSGDMLLEGNEERMNVASQPRYGNTLVK